MQRTAFKAASYRVLSKMNQQRDYHPTTLQVPEAQDSGAGHASGVAETAPAVEASRSRSFLSSLDLLGKLFHGRLYLLGGRPVPPRFLRLLTGDRTLSFSSDEDEEFRRRLGMQLKELRDVLSGGHEKSDELEQPDESRKEDGEAEAGPYASAGAGGLGRGAHRGGPGGHTHRSHVPAQ